MPSRGTGTASILVGWRRCRSQERYCPASSLLVRLVAVEYPVWHQPWGSRSLSELTEDEFVRRWYLHKLPCPRSLLVMEFLEGWKRRRDPEKYLPAAFLLVREVEVCYPVCVTG